MQDVLNAIDEEIKKKEQLIDELEDQIATARSLVTDLEVKRSEFEQLDSDSSAVAVTKRKPGRPRKTATAAATTELREGTLDAVVLSLLPEHKDGIDMDRLPAAVKKAGYKTKAKNFANSCYQCVQRLIKSGKASKEKTERNGKMAYVVSAAS